MVGALDQLLASGEVYITVRAQLAPRKFTKSSSWERLLSHSKFGSFIGFVPLVRTSAHAATMTTTPAGIHSSSAHMAHVALEFLLSG